MPQLTPPPFETLPTALLDLDVAAEARRALRARLDEADEPETVRALFAEFETLRQAWSDRGSMTTIRFQQDPADADRKATMDALDMARPQVTELDNDIKRALLEHPLRDAWTGVHGAHMEALWRAELASFAPEIAAQLIREGALCSKYTELLASFRVEVRGEWHTLSTIGKVEASHDRTLRAEAERARWTWLDGHREELDAIFDELVHLRHDMAQALGYDDYTQLGYLTMQRTGYGPDEVARFREEVLAEIVPLATALRARQREALGVDTLRAWDEEVFTPQGNPALLRDDPAWFETESRAACDAVRPSLGAFVAAMYERGYMDLYAREGKASGGFCTSFSGPQMPFIFSNSTGLMSDVRVFFHELGHAFQAWNSLDKPTDYVWPTYEAAEVHSMSLEFLVYPELHRFFGEEGAALYREIHLASALLFMPYGAAVDHFQHDLYTHPDATPAERREMWRAAEQRYMPTRDWGELEELASGSRWMFQRHIYLRPFYYIDYVLAQACALQMWAWAETDREAALDAYEGLCKRGGEAPFADLVEHAGLRSPFRRGSLADAVARARETLGI